MVLYTFDHWELNGENVGSINPATIGPITSDVTIKAVYTTGVPRPPPCFIATAAYGSPFAQQLTILRRFRDQCLPRELTKIYYQTSPPIAAYIQKRPTIRKIIRAVLKPIVKAVDKLV